MSRSSENEKPPVTGAERTAAATAARMKVSEQKAAERLRARGWVCIEPHDIADAAADPMKYVLRDRARA